MKRMTRGFLVLVLALFAASPAPASDESCSDPAVSDTYACREIVVEYVPASFDLPGLARVHGLVLIGDIPELATAWLLAPVGADVPAILAALTPPPPPATPPFGVTSAERNGSFVSPECRQLNLDFIDLGPGARPAYASQPMLALLQAPLVPRPWAGRGVTVAVLDTGVSRSHPLFASRLASYGIDLVGGDPLADDTGNGIDEDGDQVTDRGFGHGTAVAGLIALVAPGARILPVRVLDDECHGTAFRFALGIVRAADAGARVLNLSFGSRDKSSVVGKAVRYARDRGAVVVAPAGNAGTSKLQVPASESDVLAVAAVDATGVAPPWTDHGSNVKLVAPGVAVIAPFRGGYAKLDGTSFAAALASGAAALAVAADPTLTPSKLIDRLRRDAWSVDALNPALKGELGDGVPDLGALLALPLLRTRGTAPHASAPPAEALGDPTLSLPPGDITDGL